MKKVGLAIKVYGLQERGMRRPGQDRKKGGADLGSTADSAHYAKAATRDRMEGGAKE